MTASYNSNNETSFINIIKIAVPIALQQLLTASLHLVDTGFIVSLGDAPTTAVGVTGRFFFLINIIMFGLSSGMMVLSSQYWGVNDKKSIHQAFGLGMSNLLIVGILASVFCLLFPKSIMSLFTSDIYVVAIGANYIRIAGLSFIPMSIAFAYSLLLRSTANVMVPLFVSFVSVGVNTFLNYVLIFGHFGAPRLWVRGAAIATVTAATVQTILYIIICKKQDNIANAKMQELLPKNKEFVKKFYKTAIPTLSNELIWGVGVSIYVVILSWQGTSNFAAYTIFSAFDQITFTFFIGLCSACGVIIGKLVGRGELNKAYEFGKSYIKYTIIFAVLVASTLFVFAPRLVNLMNPETEYTFNMAVKIIRLFSIIFPFFIMSYIAIVGVFRPAGTPKIGMILDGVTVWFIGIPFVALGAFVLKLPFEYIYFMSGTEHFVKFFVCIYVYKKRNWLNPLTH
ncbi:MAG: MATE family efflux transporter [Eubacteriales bacterium]